MAFIFFLIYVIFLLIRPHEWGLEAQESIVVRLSLMICMAAFLSFNKNKNLNAPQFTLMLLLSSAVTISLIFTGWIGGAIELGIAFITTALIPFILVSGIIDTQKKQSIMFSLIIISALIMVLNGHTQVTSETGIGIAGNLIKVQSTAERITYLGYFNDPNDLGMFLVMTLPALFFFKGSANILLRLPLWIAIFAILYGVYLTNSRGTLVALLSLVSLWFWKKYGIKKSIFAAILLSPALLYVITRFRTISAEDASSQGRLDAWYEGYQMFISSPLFGIGNGQFLEYHNQTAHNSFVLVFAELGLYGVLIWTGILVTTVTMLIKISNLNFIPASLPEKDKRMQLAIKESRIALCLLYSLLAFMVSGFFLSRAYTPLLYLYIGMATACWGRVQVLFPGESKLYDIRQLSILTVKVTLAGIVGIFLLIKLAL